MIGRLRSLWNLPPASPAPPKRVWRDWLLVALIPLLAVFEVLVRSGIPSLIPSLVVTIVAVPVLLWRRTHPLLMLAIPFTMLEVFRLVTGEDVQLFSSAYLLLLVYALFRWGSGRALVIGLVIMLATSIASFVLAPATLADVIGGFAILLFTASLGLLFRARAGNRLRELDRAKSDEREELARDLHDTVAHHVSAIAIQAQAGLATAGTTPDAAIAALRVIEAEASSTLTEMRAMVRVLRRDGSIELAPAPNAADLRLLARSDGSGPPVDVRLSGDVEGLPAPVGAAVYRIVQESVTNARRHARAATLIEVGVDVEPDRVRLTVHDDGGRVGTTGDGYGITGMTERATLLGGTLSAGPSASGGWTVTADLPRAGGAR